VEGQFEPREVEVGRILGENREYYEVLSGLREYQQVVSGAVFLVDSEAELLSAGIPVEETHDGEAAGSEE
jgi:hypothetical protein